MVSDNSLEAYSIIQSSGKISKREKEIAYTLTQLGPSTAREIVEHLGYNDMNSVRPRITELIDKMLLEKIGDVTDNITGMKVGIFDLASKHQVSQHITKINKNLKPIKTKCPNCKGNGYVLNYK